MLSTLPEGFVFRKSMELLFRYHWIKSQYTSLFILALLFEESSVTAQDSCDMRDRLLRYFATCGQEKPLSGNLKRGEKTPENG